MASVTEKSVMIYWTFVQSSSVTTVSCRGYYRTFAPDNVCVFLN